MSCRRFALAAFLVFSLTQPSFAQQSTVDVSKLPVNLERIGRNLRQTTVREERDGINLRYQVDVFGQAPRIELFPQQLNLMSGPEPYGAPTHRQIIEQITPQEYRAPAADFSSLFRWLADKASDKSGKR